MFIPSSDRVWGVDKHARGGNGCQFRRSTNQKAAAEVDGVCTRAHDAEPLDSSSPMARYTSAQPAALRPLVERPKCDATLNASVQEKQSRTSVRRPRTRTPNATRGPAQVPRCTIAYPTAARRPTLAETLPIDFSLHSRRRRKDRRGVYRYPCLGRGTPAEPLLRAVFRAWCVYQETNVRGSIRTLVVGSA